MRASECGFSLFFNRPIFGLADIYSSNMAQKFYKMSIIKLLIDLLIILLNLGHSGLEKGNIRLHV